MAERKVFIIRSLHNSGRSDFIYLPMKNDCINQKGGEK